MQYITTAEAAEQNAAVRMRELGFADARVTNAGSDGGIDVRSKHALAQVKWQGAQVGRPAVQQLYGARGRRHEVQLFFFAATGYSQHAVQYADECEIRLFTFDPLGAASPANRAARQFLEGKPREEGTPTADERDAQATRRTEAVKASDDEPTALAERATSEIKTSPTRHQSETKFLVVANITCGFLAFAWGLANLVEAFSGDYKGPLMVGAIVSFVVSAFHFWRASRFVRAQKRRGGAVVPPNH